MRPYRGGRSGSALLDGLRWSCDARSEGSFLGLRVDRLSALEHFDEGLDLLLPPGFGLHVVHAEGQREAVLLAEVLQHCLCLGLSVDGGLEIVGDLHVLAALIGSVPVVSRRIFVKGKSGPPSAQKSIRWD